jgi:hypothetical protein
VLRDSGFDLWCGNDLCAWKIERGDIKRVPTWNEGDPGVELVGNDVAIEQLSPVNSVDGGCIEFSLMANVDPNVDVELNVDILGDGSIEYNERLPSTDWKPLKYQILIGDKYAGIRFELAKTGAGHAELSNIGAKLVSGGCQGLTPIVATSRPLGAPCRVATDCASGICGDSIIQPPFNLGGLFFVGNLVCVGCSGDQDCTAPGMVCGLGDPTSPVRATPRTCVPTAGRVLGDQCIESAECATGVCADHVCSTCDTSGGCASGEQCDNAWDPSAQATADFGVPPQVCSPNLHRRQSGEPCVSDADCASSSCAGPERKQCMDGRSCATAADCPFDNIGNGLQNSPCNTVGIEGGTCQ